MKFSQATLFAATILGVAAQDIPDCGKTCINNMRQKAQELGCKSDDVGCMCKNVDFAYGVRDCSNESCPSGDDASKVISYAVNLCASEGVVVTTGNGDQTKTDDNATKTDDKDASQTDDNSSTKTDDDEGKTTVTSTSTSTSETNSETATDTSAESTSTNGSGDDDNDNNGSNTSDNDDDNNGDDDNAAGAVSVSMGLLAAFGLLAVTM